MRSKTLRLYNVFFPIWALFLFAPGFGWKALFTLWIPLILGNFIFDSVVIWIGLIFLKEKENRKAIWKRTIIPTFLFGFLSDLIGCLISFCVYFLNNVFSLEKLNKDFFYSVLGQRILMIWWASFGVLTAGFCIYWFNKKFALAKCQKWLNPKQIRTLSLWLAIFTAPYIMLIPPF